MTEETKDETVQTSSTEQQVEVVEEIQQPPVTTDEQGTERRDFKEELVAKLMQGTLDTPAESAETPAPKADDKPTSEEPAEEAEKPEETESEPEEATDDEKKEWPESAKKRVSQYAYKARKLREENTALKGTAAFGTLVTDLGASGGIKPKEMADWVSMAVQLKTNPQLGLQRLIATARAFGYKEPEAPAPKKQESPEKVVDEIYDEHFKDEVDEGLISESAARRKAKAWASERAAKPEPVQTPAPSQPHIQTQQPRGESLEDAGAKALDDLQETYAKQDPNWKKIEAKVLARAKVEISGKSPFLWVSEAERIIREEKAKLAPAADPRKTAAPVASTTLRPTTAPAGKEAGGDFKSDLVRKLMTGKL